MNIRCRDILVDMQSYHSIDMRVLIVAYGCMFAFCGAAFWLLALPGHAHAGSPIQVNPNQPSPLYAPPPTFNAGGPPPPSGGGGGGAIPNPLNTSSVYQFFLELIKIAITAGTYVLVLAIIYTGFLFVTAQGDEPKIARARASLLYTVIGGAILLGAWVIATAVATTVASL